MGSLRWSLLLYDRYTTEEQSHLYRVNYRFTISIHSVFADGPRQMRATLENFLGKLPASSSRDCLDTGNAKRVCGQTSNIVPSDYTYAALAPASPHAPGAMPLFHSRFKKTTANGFTAVPCVWHFHILWPTEKVLGRRGRSSSIPLLHKRHAKIARSRPRCFVPP